MRRYLRTIENLYTRTDTRTTFPYDMGLRQYLQCKSQCRPTLMSMSSRRKPVAVASVGRSSSEFLRAALIFSLVTGIIVFMGVNLNAHPSDGWRPIEIPSISLDVQ